MMRSAPQPSAMWWNRRLARARQAYGHPFLFWPTWAALAAWHTWASGTRGGAGAIAARSALLGAALIVMAVSRRPPARDHAAGGGGRPHDYCPHIYAALLLGLGLPTLLWRCLDPDNEAALAAVREGSSICFVFGLMALAAARVQGVRALGASAPGARLSSSVSRVVAPREDLTPVEPRCDTRKPAGRASPLY